MKLTTKTIIRWLTENANTCTLAELDAMQAQITSARDKAAVKAQRIATALAAAEAAAKEAGLSLSELVKRERTGAGKHPVTSVSIRKPYLNPFDAESPLYALSTKRFGQSLPQWAADLVGQGWTLDELHYKQHAAALAKRGITPVYDAEERYNRLVALAAMSK